MILNNTYGEIPFVHCQDETDYWILLQTDKVVKALNKDSFYVHWKKRYFSIFGRKKVGK